MSQSMKSCVGGLHRSNGESPPLATEPEFRIVVCMDTVGVEELLATTTSSPAWDFFRIARKQASLKCTLHFITYLVSNLYQER